VGCFFIGKQKVVLFPTFRKNEGKGKGREAARNALTSISNLVSRTFAFAQLIIAYFGKYN
jgi:hypothetical protein